jgi:hypothetical protein
MDSRVPAFLHSFNQTIEQCEHLISIARDSALQLVACSQLEQEIIRVLEEKNHASEDGDEDYANCLLGCECVARALLAELSMWLLLKQEEPEKAWDQLIGAQQAMRGAMRAHRGFSHVMPHIDRLETFEALVFPPQVFVSAGLIVRSQKCSICGTEYGDCEHVAGRPYMGRFCAIIAADLEANHVAIVEKPADKRCRITSFDTPEGRRNRMTWKLQDETPNETDAESNATPSETGVRANAIIMRAD